MIHKHMAQHTTITNNFGDIIKEVSNLKDTAERLNQENISLKKILSDVLPMVSAIEFTYNEYPKYTEIIKSIIEKG